MQIFISYARVDQVIALQIAGDLTTQGYQIWIDAQRIPQGAHWDTEIQRGLAESDLMIVLLTPASASSQNVADEWSYFIDKKKRIQPVLVQPCEVPFRLMRMQRIDLTRGYQKGLSELLNALLEPPSGEDWAGTPSNTPSAATFNNTVWADRYHWWRGLGPSFAIGEISVLPKEWRLVSPDRLPVVIPTSQVIKAQVIRTRWDTYLKVTFQDAAQHAHQVIISTVERRSRATTVETILRALTQSAGRALNN